MKKLCRIIPKFALMLAVLIGMICLYTPIVRADVDNEQVMANSTESSEVRELNEGASIAQTAFLEQAPLSMRSTFLKVALIAWAVNQNGIFIEPDLDEVSKAGFLPIWCFDPFDNEPIRILREIDPVSSQVTYWPVEGKGWDLSLITPAKVNNENADVSYLESAESQKAVWGLCTSAPAGTDNKTKMSSDEWDLLVWSMTTACESIIDFYIADHESMPGSLQDLLNGQFFINEDYLKNSSELISQGAYEHFEIGVVHDSNLMYTEFVRRDNHDEMILVRKYNIGPDGYDPFDPNRWEWVFTGLPEGAEKSILLSSEMLKNPDEWINGVDHRQLIDFYINGS